MGIYSVVKTALGNVSGPTGVATWVVAGAAYVAYLRWQSEAAGGGFTDADRDAYNAARKKETAAAAATGAAAVASDAKSR
jgi:hypothetical protein